MSNAPADQPEIYQLKATLLGTDPPVWRRLLVPADLTLEKLHRILQVAMDWEDGHLHEFRVGKQRYGMPNDMEAYLDGPKTISERRACLDSVLQRVRSKVLYTYDFGDDWQLEIVLEKRLKPEPGRDYPICIGGERQGPPEDCGGIPGFYNLLEVVRNRDNPDNDQFAELLDFVGQDWDPEVFNMEKVNKGLAAMQRARKKAAGGK